MSVEVIYRSSELAIADRIPIWNDVIWRNYVPLNVKIAPRNDFVGQVSVSQLGSVRVVTAGSKAQLITRTPRLIAQDDEEFLMLGLQMRGLATVEQLNRRAQVRPGDFVFWDTRQTYNITFPQDWEMAVFQFPRAAFTFSNRTINSMTALTLNGQKGLTHITAAFLTGIANQARCQSFEHDISLLAHTQGLLTLCIDQQLKDRDVPLAYNEVLLRRINDYIYSNLTNPRLSTKDIAQAHGLSVRQLYRLFQEHHTTVGDFIRHQRLERIKEELVRPNSRYITIAAIARKWGFPDTPHFNRVFKQQYKTTPQQFQRQPPVTLSTAIEY